MKLTPTARRAWLGVWTSRISFGVGVTVTLAANVTASQHTPVGIMVGIWPPIAFLMSMALIENVPVKGHGARLRVVAIGTLAALAAWCSYWHLVEVFDMGGADSFSAHALPLTVDVLIALASPGMRTRKPAPVAARRPSRAKNVTPIRPKKTAVAG